MKYYCPIIEMNMRKGFILLAVILAFSSLGICGGTTNVDMEIAVDSSTELSAVGDSDNSTKKGKLYVVATKQKLNVRGGAYKNAPVVGQLDSGDSIMVYNTVNGWAVIRYNSGIGFVSLSYLKPFPDDNEESTDSVAVTGTDILEVEDELLLEDDESEEEDTDSARGIEADTLKGEDSYTASSAGKDTASDRKKVKKEEVSSGELSEQKSTDKDVTELSKRVSVNETEEENNIRFCYAAHLDGLLSFYSGGIAGGAFGGNIEGGTLLFNDNFAGIGIGLSGFWTNPPMKNLTTLYMPVYVTDRYYFLSENKISPFTEVSIGGNVIFNKMKGQDIQTSGAFFMRAGFGATFDGTYIGMGYQLLASNGTCGHSMYFKIGFEGR